MKRVILALSLLFLSACSDPPGWLLWSHIYSTLDERPSGDAWFSHQSFFKMAECKGEIQTEIARRADAAEKDKRESKDYKFTIQQEKESLKVTVIRPLTEKRETIGVSITRFFCVPLGVDPRPKDQSTWILWESHAVFSSGKEVESSRWYPKGGYLTEIACDAANYYERKFNEEMNQKAEEKQQNNPAKRRVDYYYNCLPSGVDPVGKG